MKLKLFLIMFMIGSLLIVSVNAQKRRIGPNPIDQVILQDDNSGDHLIFFPSSGDYKFENCSGNFTIGGIGKVELSGCKMTLTDISETRFVVAETDLCAGAGKAVITFKDNGRGQTDLPPFDFTVSDSNTRDSTFDCNTIVK